MPELTLADVKQCAREAAEVTDRVLPENWDMGGHGEDRRALRAACLSTVLAYLLTHPLAGT